MRKLLLFPLLLAANIASAQLNIDTLAFQDFEVTPAPPVWTFTGPVIYNSGYSTASAAPANSPIGIGGSRAWETTSNSGGLLLEFVNTAVPAGYDSIRVRFNLAAMNLITSTGGPDNLDYVLIAYSVDGGANYVNRMRIRGPVNDNGFWPYSATGYAKNYYQPATEQVFQPVNPGLQTTLGYSTCEIVFPGTITQIAMRITGRSSSSTDTWLVDNLVLTGENNCAASFSSITPVACDSYTSPSGNVYTSSAAFSDTIQNTAGCDSVILVNLVVHSSSASSISPVACESYVSPAGNVHTASGVFNDTIPNGNGCDSVITVNLTVNSSTTSGINPVVCDTYTSPSGMIHTASGVFNDTIPNSSGCDSVITINLVVNTVDASVTTSAITITANASGAQYQWIDCGNGNAPLAGETGQSFTATVNGSYAVIVTQNGCSDTSSCEQILSVGLAEKTASGLEVYPNPAQDVLNVRLAKTAGLVTIRLTALNGQVLREQQFRNTAMLKLSLAGLPAGAYFLNVTADEAAHVLKVMRD